MLLFKFVGFLLIALGSAMSYGAGYFVKKFQLDQNSACDFEEELSDIELIEYKFNKALINLKTFGMLVLLPGVFFVYYGFK